MSQVHLDLYQKVPVVKKTKVIENTFFSKIKSSFLIGWSLIQNLIIGLIAIWPLLLTIGVVLTLRRSIFRYIRRFRD